MDGQIYVLDEGELHALSESTYEAEETLQELLGDHPNLLAGEQMDDPVFCQVNSLGRSELKIPKT